MSATVVWLDHKTAKLFKMVPGKMETENLHRDDGGGHEASHKKAMEEKYYHELAKRISAASEILLVGPGLAKQEFKHHLEKHHHEAIAKKVVGMETVDHPTEKQVLATARKFFKKFDLYAGE